MSARMAFDSRTRDQDPHHSATRAAVANLVKSRTIVIRDFPQKGLRYLDSYRTVDCNPDVRGAILRCLHERYVGYDIDGIAGIGNGGLSVGGALAHLLEIPFYPIRKAGDTVYDAHSVTVGMVYATRELTLARDAVSSGARVVIYDDSIATGGTLKGGIDLLLMAGARVPEAATVYEWECRGGRQAVVPTHLFSIVSATAF